MLCLMTDFGHWPKKAATTRCGKSKTDRTRCGRYQNSHNAFWMVFQFPQRVVEKLYCHDAL